MTTTNTASSAIDLLINAKWIIPVIPEDAVFEDCAIAVKDKKIIAIVPQTEAEKRFQEIKAIKNLNQHIVIPGLINAHGHLAMSLLRGYADDLPLQEWLEKNIWPAEGQWISEQFVYEGTQLAMAEMIRSGTTCVADMYFFPDQAAKAAQHAGMRAQITAPVLDFPTPWAQDADQYISKALAVHDDFRTSSLITVGFGPHAPYTVSDQPLQRIATLAPELQTPVQIHLHETEFEVSDALEKTGMRPVERLEKMNFLSPLVQCVHLTQVEKSDIDILKKTGAHVVHCPESNLKLASGFCPITELLDAGINVALGTDGAASNNDLDLFGEMRTAALLAKGISKNAAAIDAHQALQLATINGAKALGLEDITGSLETGKAADFAAIKIDTIESAPMFNPISHLVYTSASKHITDVWIDGKHVLKDKELTTLNEIEILQQAKNWQEKINKSS
ncbi:MAG: TRZ/ATZ family hydrolase [Cellvibrionaceae bacterium]